MILKNDFKIKNDKEIIHELQRYTYETKEEEIEYINKVLYEYVGLIPLEFYEKFEYNFITLKKYRQFVSKDEMIKIYKKFIEDRLYDTNTSSLKVTFINSEMYKFNSYFKKRNIDNINFIENKINNITKEDLDIYFDLLWKFFGNSKYKQNVYNKSIIGAVFDINFTDETTKDEMFKLVFNKIKLDYPKNIFEKDKLVKYYTREVDKIFNYYNKLTNGREYLMLVEYLLKRDIEPINKTLYKQCLLEIKL